MYLTGYDHRVNHIAKIIHCGKVFHGHFARFRINLNLASIRTRWVRKIPWIIKRRFFQTRLEIFNRIILRDIGFKGHFAKGNRFIGSRNTELTILEFNICLCCFQHMRSDFGGFIDDLLGCAHHSWTTNRNTARPIRAHTKRYFRRISMYDIDRRLINTQHFRNHLRKGCFMALPSALRANHHRKIARCIHPHGRRIIITHTAAQDPGQV